MEPDATSTDPDADPGPADQGATSERATGREPAEPGPEHDPTTSREAFEREMAERGRSDEAQFQGDHID